MMQWHRGLVQRGMLLDALEESKWKPDELSSGSNCNTKFDLYLHQPKRHWTEVISHQKWHESVQFNIILQTVQDLACKLILFNCTLILFNWEKSQCSCDFSCESETKERKATLQAMCTCIKFSTADWRGAARRRGERRGERRGVRLGVGDLDCFPCPLNLLECLRRWSLTGVGGPGFWYTGPCRALSHKTHKPFTPGFNPHRGESNGEIYWFIYWRLIAQSTAQGHLRALWREGGVQIGVFTNIIKLGLNQ